METNELRINARSKFDFRPGEIKNGANAYNSTLSPIILLKSTVDKKAAIIVTKWA